MFIAIIGMGFSMFLLGPSWLLGIPQKWYIVGCAFPVLGVFQAFIYLPILPEVIERLQTTYTIKEDDPLYDQLNDKANDIYGLFYAGSMFISPLLGSWLNSIIG